MEEQQPKRPPFKVSGSAAIKHLNVRKEGPDDEKILAVDIKMEIKGIDKALCGYFDEALEAFLWRGDTDALIVRNLWLAPVQYGNLVSSATAEIGSQTFVGAEIKKFSIAPRDGGVIALTCSVTIYPTASEVSQLAKLVQDETRVLLEGPPDLFADGIESSGTSTTTDNQDGDDPMLQDAIKVVLESGRASISFVQRKLAIGYNRAARLMEAMEKKGLVSAMNGSGNREILNKEQP